MKSRTKSRRSEIDIRKPARALVTMMIKKKPKKRKAKKGEKK